MYHQRRIYLVDRSFQLKYILWLIAWGVVVAALFGLWTYQAHQQAVETVVRDPEQRALFESANRQLIWALAGIGALSAAALGLLGFVMTHRVAGPIYVMSHLLNLLAQGRYPSKRGLRKSDELQDFYAQFTDTVRAMRERETERVERLQDAIATMRSALPRAPELAEAIQVLEHEAQSRREALTEDLAPAAAAVPGSAGTKS